MLGLAAGDALGTTLEFESPGTFKPLTDMVGGGPFRLPVGAWTDDTSMALCLAESLVESGGFDPDDQMSRYLKWWREGYLSSTGKFFDIGGTTSLALRRFEENGVAYAGSKDESSAGNGALMRLAPIPLAYFRKLNDLIPAAYRSSRTTHGAPQSLEACRYLAELIVGALRGASKEELVGGEAFSLDEPAPIQHNEIDSVAAGSFREKDPPEIRGNGYVVSTLEAALWAFYNFDDFESGALAVVNLGEDADTTGAVYGQIAGAYYGVDGIPERWLEKIVMREKIEELADGLLSLSGRLAS